MPYSELLAASEEELLFLWDSWVEYCEDRAAEMKRHTEQSTHGR